MCDEVKELNITPAVSVFTDGYSFAACQGPAKPYVASKLEKDQLKVTSVGSALNHMRLLSHFTQLLKEVCELYKVSFSTSFTLDARKIVAVGAQATR